MCRRGIRDSRHGGAGGVGHVAVQIARAHGADVFATTSAHHFDTVGGEVLDASFEAVRTFTGHVVSVRWSSHSISPLGFRNAAYSGIFTLAPMLSGHGRHHQRQIHQGVAALAETGKLKPRLDSRHFTLSDAAKAYAAVENGTAAGKTVIDIDH